MEKKDQAYRDWKRGMKYKEIAEKYRVSLSTVKSWAVRYWKEKGTEKVADNAEKRLQPKQKVATNEEKKLQPKKSNLGGAPKGNKNRLKHGIYEKILFDFLSEEEQQLFLEQEMDEAEECRKMIRFCDVQIMKFMRKIKELEEKPGGLVVCGVSKKKGRIEGLQRDAASDFTEEQTTTSTTAVHELILRYNNEIEKAKKQKMKCLELLLKYEQQKDGEQEQTSAVHIYLPSNDRETTENR